jgi:hypothetical protein
MTKFSKQEIVYRACKTVVQHIKNHIEEERGGIHSRLFSHILHPEREFVCVGKSAEVLAGAAVHPEHLVPCIVLIREVRKLLLKKRLADEEIAKLLQKHWKIALISKEQAKYIDFELGYRSTMPDGWCFETGDTFERLTAARISLARMEAPPDAHISWQRPEVAVD